MPAYRRTRSRGSEPSAGLSPRPPWRRITGVARRLSGQRVALTRSTVSTSTRKASSGPPHQLRAASGGTARCSGREPLPRSLPAQPGPAACSPVARQGASPGPWSAACATASRSSSAGVSLTGHPFGYRDRPVQAPHDSVPSGLDDPTPPAAGDQPCSTPIALSRRLASSLAGSKGRVTAPL